LSSPTCGHDAFRALAAVAVAEEVEVAAAGVAEEADNASHD